MNKIQRDITKNGFTPDQVKMDRRYYPAKENFTS
jgi:hypothetical protein